MALELGQDFKVEIILLEGIEEKLCETGNPRNCSGQIVGGLAQRV